MPKTPNPCARRVTPEHAYEVWQSLNGAMTYWVLKKYQSPEHEEQNPHSLWYVWTTSPGTSDGGEYGDAIVVDVKRNCVQVDNPLCHYLCIWPATHKTLDMIGLKQYRATALEEFEKLLALYMRLAVPKKKLAEVEKLLEDYNIRIVCKDKDDYLAQCLTNVQTGG